MDDLEENLEAFGIKFEWWPDAAQEAGKWLTVRGGRDRGLHAETAQG